MCPPGPHADVKSSNVLLAADGTAKLVDCSLSKAVQHSRTAAEGGTFLYAGECGAHKVGRASALRPLCSAVVHHAVPLLQPGWARCYCAAGLLRCARSASASAISTAAAPEQLMGERVDEKADTFAFGLLLMVRTRRVSRPLCIDALQCDGTCRPAPTWGMHMQRVCL